MQQALNESAWISEHASERMEHPLLDIFFMFAKMGLKYIHFSDITMCVSDAMLFRHLLMPEFMQW